MTKNVYLVYLAWPEACFAADAKDVRFLKTLVPTGSRIVRVSSDVAFLRHLPTATHVLTWHFREEWFARAPALRVLATPAAGREFVPPDAPEGVAVHFGRFHGAFMAESVVGFMLAWSRGFFRPEAHLPWARAAMGDKCRTLAGTRAVILGYGRVGRAIGGALEKMGAEVFGYSRHLKIPAQTLYSRIRTADWLVMALPGDTGTDDMLDAKMLRRLKRECVVVNVGRGNSVDEDALLEALRSGRLAGAFLDVVKGEKYGSEETVPPIRRRSDLPWNLIVMPHASAFSTDYMRAFIRELKNDGCL